MDTNRKSLTQISDFGDKRLNLRFDKITSTLNGQLNCSIPQAFKRWGDAKAVYRFLGNEKVNSVAMLSSELNKWSEDRMRNQSVILALHDTTEVNLTGNRSHDNLGCLSADFQKGFFVHSTLLCSETGIPQVVFYQHYWNRDPEMLHRKKERKYLPIEHKESNRWIEGIERIKEYFKKYPETKVINICDREGDIYELLSTANKGNSDYIIRSCNNRKLQNDEDKIWDRLKREKVHGTYNIEVYDAQTMQNRKATISIRWLQNISLSPTYRKGQAMKPIKVNMVYLEEINCPKGTNPISWKLLTSLEVGSLKQAIKICNYYKYRWRIESFHFVLKQGCKIEDLQLEDPHNLQNAIALYSILSCRLLSMMCYSREKPQENVCTVGYTEAHYKILYTFLEVNHKIKISKEIKNNCSVGNITYLIGILGGYKKHNTTYPGIKVLWRGLKEFETILQCMILLSEKRYG